MDNDAGILRNTTRRDLGEFGSLPCEGLHRCREAGTVRRGGAARYAD
jgi:hypothetical protein